MRRKRTRLVLIVALAAGVAVLALTTIGQPGQEKFCNLGLALHDVDGVTLITRDNEPHNPHCMKNGEPGEPDNLFPGVTEEDCSITYQPTWTGPSPATAPPLRDDGTCSDGWDF